MAFEPGQRIGDYEVVARLGAGGLGVVYEVRHLISQRREAMKIMLPDQSAAPEMVERFHREVQTLATLSHPGIAQLHTAFYYENQLAMVMELIHGETLRNRQLRAPISLAEAVGYGAQILEALVYAHRLGVVHRDIKPSNIMITDGGTVKLLDFGIALTGKGSELTQSGYLLGSISYMSPEQISGDKANPSSDLYSVGVTLYELLTGVLPITGANNYEIMMGHLHKIPVPPHMKNAAVPEGLSLTILRALAKDPAQRFSTADEFLAALQQPSGRTLHAMQTVASLPVPPVGIRGRADMSSSSGMRSTGSNSTGSKLTSPSGLQNLSLEELTRRLAVYIGPVARFVVKKLAAQSDNIEFIAQEAAKEIPSERDRAAFLHPRTK